MDANKFMRKYKRICASYNDCRDCPLRTDNGQCTETPSRFTKEFIDKVTKVVEDWSAHPVPTRADMFKKTYPNAPTHNNGALLLCPRYLDKNIKCSAGLYCYQCRKEYWLKEVQDGC